MNKSDLQIDLKTFLTERLEILRNQIRLISLESCCFHDPVPDKEECFSGNVVYKTKKSY